jgi:hypothetical protein
MREGKRPQQDAVDHAEHSAVGAKAQGERQNGRQCEPWILSECSQREAQVFKQ